MKNQVLPPTVVLGLAAVFAASLVATPPAVAGGCLLTCPANITVGTAAPACSEVVSYPAPTASGSCGTVTCTPASGSTFFGPPAGPTQVNCTSTIGGGACSFMITVNDDDPPLLNCGANTQAVSPDGNPVQVNYPGIQLGDNCPGTVSGSCMPPPNSLFPVGATQVNCSATDGVGNPNTCQLTVTVVRQSVTEIPALSGRSLFGLAALLALAGVVAVLRWRG